MRNFLIVVALSATFAIAGNVMAQDLWWDGTLGGGYASSFGTLGLDEGSGSSLSFSGTQTQTVNNLYLKSPVAVGNSGGTTRINHLWVTTDTVGTGNNFTGTGGTIGDFTLYVGEQQVMGKTFGVFTAESVIMSDIAIAGAGNPFGSTWEITGQRNLVNDGRINNLAYNGGNYSGNGTVGTLTAGKTLVESNIKQADALAFDTRYATNGGLITLTGAGNFDAVDYDVSGLDGLETQAIDFTNAAIDVVFGQDVTGVTNVLTAFNDWVGTTADGLGNVFNIDFASIFGVDDIAGLNSLSSFDVLFGSNAASFSITDSLWGTEGLGTWAVDTDNSLVSYTAASAPPVDPSPVPEPATLAMLGLGLAGLGLVSRRRRK